ncbi:MAG: DUF2283 domain-containing protein [Candidatus Dormibacteraeota bacterium]|nr:DUF2283 domain-containing protein [Candidatus Dormibacteraeota bacterium]
MRLEYDSEADAAYVWLREGAERAFGIDLDNRRYVDFSTDEVPVGIELLGVSLGVDTTGLPARERVEVLLSQHDIRILP